MPISAKPISSLPLSALSVQESIVVCGFPATLVSLTAGVGTVAWTNPSNAGADDGSYAECSTLDGEITEYLKGTNLGFSIPSSKTILGIVVQVEKRCTAGGAGNNYIDENAKLVKAGSIVGDNKAKSTRWPITDTMLTYGSDTDLWGTTWTPDEINASDFGFVINAGDTGDQTGRIDYIRVCVYYINTTFDVDGSGGATGGGTATVDVVYNPAATGGGTCGGSANPIIEVNGSGGATAGGTGTLSVTYTINGSGGAVAGGAAIDQHNISQDTWNEVGSGGATAGGTATLYTVRTITASGGGTVNGGSVKRFLCADCCNGGLVADTFWDDEDALLTQHQSETGAYWTADADLVLQGSAVLSNTTDQAFAVQSAGQDDYTVNVTITPQEFDGKISVVFRYLNSANHWRVQFEPANSALRILEVTGSLETQKAFDLVTFETFSPYTLSVLVKDTTIIASFNGTDIEATASSFLTQQFVGFMLEGGDNAPTSTVDNFCCTPPVHHVEGSGGVRGDGSATLQFIQNPRTSGGVRISGLSDSDPLFFNEGDGGAVVGGEATEGVSFGTTLGGGAVASGTGTVSSRQSVTATGGAVAGGKAVFVYSITASGGAIVGAPSYTNGFQYRKKITVTPTHNLTNFPLAFRLNVDPALTITDIAATDVSNNVLPSEFVNFTNGKLYGIVRTDLSGSVETELYIYYGG